jgi:DNA-directed RNA polymerase subunit F
MTKPKLISEEPMSMSDVKDKLADIKKRDKELNFRANKTEEYLNQFVELSDKQAKELKEKLAGLKITRLRDTHMIKLMDVMPTTPNEIKTVLQGYTMTLSAEDLKRIADLIKEYASKK